MAQRDQHKLVTGQFIISTPIFQNKCFLLRFHLKIDRFLVLGTKEVFSLNRLKHKNKGQDCWILLHERLQKIRLNQPLGLPFLNGSPPQPFFKNGHSRQLFCLFSFYSINFNTIKLFSSACEASTLTNGMTVFKHCSSSAMISVVLA